MSPPDEKNGAIVETGCQTKRQRPLPMPSELNFPVSEEPIILGR